MSPGRHIEDLLRDAAPQVLAAVVRRFGDFTDAEDTVQEAMLAAAQQWPRQGTPDNPVGWLIEVASRRMVDQARSETARRDREALAAAREPRDLPPAADHDDTLALMFMSCHPALTPASAIALTLRAVTWRLSGCRGFEDVVDAFSREPLLAWIERVAGLVELADVAACGDRPRVYQLIGAAYHELTRSD